MKKLSFEKYNTLKSKMDFMQVGQSGQKIEFSLSTISYQILHNGGKNLI